MSYALCPPLRVPEGEALAGGSMETYLAGTSTPLATYADMVGTANPTTIPLNTSGRPDGAVYLATTDANGGPVAYKFIVKDAAGQTIYTQDDVRAGGLQLFDLGNVVNLEDFPTLQDAIDAIGPDQRTLVVGKASPVAADTTVPANVELLFLGEGMLSPAVGVTLTINGPMGTPDRQVFGTAGAVIFGTDIRRSVNPTWWGAVPGGDATTNTSAAQAAFDAISILDADTGVTPLGDTGGQVVWPPGDFEINSVVDSISDAVQVIGAGVATRILCSGAGGFRFGYLEPGGDKNHPASHNVKHCFVDRLHIQALPGRVAGPLIDVPLSSRFSLTNVRMSSGEPNNLITGIKLSGFQGVTIANCLINVNAYPIHLLANGVDPEWEAHVTIRDTELFLSGNSTVGTCAALHIEQGAGATDPIRDMRLDRVLMAAFTLDAANEANTVGLKITNPNVSPAVVGMVCTGCMFEQCEVLVDAGTYAPNDTSHIAFLGSAFLGNTKSLVGWKGNDFKSRPYFQDCTFANLGDAIVQADPTVGPHNYPNGVTGNLVSDPANVRHNGVEQPFIGQAKFRDGGVVSIASGSAIAHGLIATPSRVLLTAGSGQYNVGVAGKDATTITVGIRDLQDNPIVSPVSVYWEAAV